MSNCFEDNPSCRLIEREKSIPARVRNWAISDQGLETLGDLTTKTAAEIAAVRGIGGNSVMGTILALGEYGLRLRDHDARMYFQKYSSHGMDPFGVVFCFMMYVHCLGTGCEQRAKFFREGLYRLGIDVVLDRRKAVWVAESRDPNDCEVRYDG